VVAVLDLVVLIGEIGYTHLQLYFGRRFIGHLHIQACKGPTLIIDQCIDGTLQPATALAVNARYELPMLGGTPLQVREQLVPGVSVGTAPPPSTTRTRSE